MSSFSPRCPDTKHRTARPVFDAHTYFSQEVPTTYRSGWSIFRCLLRLTSFTLWSGIILGVQGILHFIPAQARVRLPQFFWKVTCKIMGIDIRVIGQNIGHYNSKKDIQNGIRPVVYVANHSSWLDILVLGKLLPANFVAKKQVRCWPLIGPLSRVGRSIYITRNRQGAGNEVSEVIKRLHEGDNIIFFPEGTTSDGNQVLPFFSSIFAITKASPARNQNIQENLAPPPLLVQSISIVYDRIENLPVGRNRRLSVFSWFGDMELIPHLWAFGQWRSVRASVLFHPPLDPADFASRKLLAQKTHEIIRQSHEDLRQNRIPD